MSLTLKRILERSVAVYDTKLAAIQDLAKQTAYFTGGLSMKRNPAHELLNAEFKSVRDHREVLQTMINVILEEEANS